MFTKCSIVFPYKNPHLVQPIESLYMLVLLFFPLILLYLLDNKVFLTMTNTQSVPFDNRHYLLLNIAMGGNLGGTIDPNFTEDEMVVDYVRVFQKN